MEMSSTPNGGQGGLYKHGVKHMKFSFPRKLLTNFEFMYQLKLWD
jgi:hypothetical protein